jgi:hypothetical protein
MKRWHILAAASLVTVTVAVAGCGRSGRSGRSSSTQAVDSFAIAQMQETLDAGLVPGRALTGCAAEPGNKWLCITYTASLARTVTPALIALAETASDPRINGHVWKLENGTLANFSDTVPPVPLHGSRFELAPLVSQDGPPPLGRRTDGLTFYYSSPNTPPRNFSVSCGETSGETNVCS